MLQRFCNKQHIYYFRKKALSVTGGGVEQAMEWLLAHADDPGINDPPAEKEKEPEGAVG